MRIHILTESEKNALKKSRHALKEKQASLIWDIRNVDSWIHGGCLFAYRKNVRTFKKQRRAFASDLSIINQQLLGLEDTIRKGKVKTKIGGR